VFRGNAVLAQRVDEGRDGRQHRVDVTGILRVWIVSAAARRTIAMIARGAGMVFDVRVVSGI